MLYYNSSRRRKDKTKVSAASASESGEVDETLSEQTETCIHDEKLLAHSNNDLQAEEEMKLDSTSENDIRMRSNKNNDVKNDV